MADSDHFVGALVVTFSIIAWAEVARAVRFINVVFGAWLVAAPWVLTGAGSRPAVINGIASGIMLVLLALPTGRIDNSYAGWDRYIK